MTDYHYAQLLAAHDSLVREGPAEERAFRELSGEAEWVEPVPVFGLSGGQMLDTRETLARILAGAISHP